MSECGGGVEGLGVGVSGGGGRGGRGGVACVVSLDTEEALDVGSAEFGKSGEEDCLFVLQLHLSFNVFLLLLLQTLCECVCVSVCVCERERERVNIRVLYSLVSVSHTHADTNTLTHTRTHTHTPQCISWHSAAEPEWSTCQEVEHAVSEPQDSPSTVLS